ncbi:hypothetical protein MITSMUL_05521 [Mitsuokella multacida DSM 20544]|uniref:Uncharacterized protein n=1 Tax=Mitsuokella multacida DSM 20544 TaxID=500635 RepID=C9KQK2_9FIRM|nr:hypothetical protein MITSMUL_05521 [Mitsuokella multacida DSM 20544]
MPILADRAAVFYEKAHQTHRTHKKEIPQIEESLFAFGYLIYCQPCKVQ